MPIESSALTLNLAELSARLLEELEFLPRARITAHWIADALPGSSVNIYASSALADEDGWNILASGGEAQVVEAVIPLESGTLGVLARELKSLLFEGTELVREEYAHVNVRRTLLSLAYIPLLHDGGLIGAIEIFTFDSALNEAHLEALAPGRRDRRRSLVRRARLSGRAPQHPRIHHPAHPAL